MTLLITPVTELAFFAHFSFGRWLALMVPLWVLSGLVGWWSFDIYYHRRSERKG